ncbi:MAG: toll/interleukin-1 receptor domain-containing protein [Proteobacteria bacterium]|nr:toll/interleukin-1 receptor domain-containing protein [Pseudomonadota bacterium]
MSSVFLCHSSKDKPFAASLASKLAAEDIKVWIDEAEIKTGDSLSEKIGSAINEMSYFAIILSNNSIGSQWIKRELQAAIQKELFEKRVVILPLLLNEVDLPPFLRDKKYANFIDVDKFDESYEQLLTVLKPVATKRLVDNITSFEIRRVKRKKTNTKCQIDGNDIVIVDISKENLGFLSNIHFIYNEVQTINIEHDYLSEIIKFVVTRLMIADGKTGFNYFIGADILGRDIHI